VFDTQVDWHENHQLLKVEFPLAVHAPNALYETQFGYVERPTHRNTSWDVARFEVCAQRWAALREYGFGVALLNDSKHGYSTLGNCMTLSLLRAPAYPDATADRGTHQFRYALMPFDGKLPQVIRAGADFNTPLIAHPHVNPTQAFSMFKMNCEHVVIDTVKWAEDSDEVIVRIYEACGGRSTVTLQTDLTLRAVSRCNLLEKAEASLAIVDNTFHFDIHPFQLLTFKVAIEDKSL
ncbi:MAG: glycoside hydrolase family 38 C-terminal domain-containing protein, partial [Chloroflexota bacterium]